MKKLIIIALVFAAVVRVNATTFTFDLQGTAGFGMLAGNQNPAVVGGSGGEVGAGILYDDVANLLTINVGWGSGQGFTDLTGTVTVAHIHQAPDALFTSNGGVIVNLDGATPGFNNSATNGGWTNTQVTLSAPQETALFSGFLYLNAHTANNPNGEIRGNLVNPVVVPEPSTYSLIGLGALGLLVWRRKKSIAA